RREKGGIGDRVTVRERVQGPRQQSGQAGQGAGGRADQSSVPVDRHPATGLLVRPPGRARQGILEIVVTLALAAVVAAHPSATQVPAEVATACTSPLWPALARFVLQDGTAVAPR